MEDKGNHVPVWIVVINLLLFLNGIPFDIVILVLCIASSSPTYIHKTYYTYIYDNLPLYSEQLVHLVRYTYMVWSCKTIIRAQLHRHSYKAID